MLDWIYTADYAILNALQSIHTSFLDGVMRVASVLGGTAGLFWILLTLILVLHKKTRKVGLCMAVALAFEFIGCNLILKNLVQRVRPYDNPLTSLTREDLAGMGVSLPYDTSFPSGHAGAAFACALACFKNHKPWGAFLLVCASVIAFSRLYQYIHFPSDVLVGVLLGVVCALIACPIIRRLCEHPKTKGAMEKILAFSLRKS